jgi:hypothetical protein
VIWITGQRCSVRGISMSNIPRWGIVFEDAADGLVSECRLLGNFPYASYTGINTAHGGIFYNPPPQTSDAKPSLRINANLIRGCVQGFLLGNYDNTARETGISVVGNSFGDCWDHGVYMTIGEGHAIVGNTFLNCRAPIVTDGNSAVVNGNTLYSPETGQSNYEQWISVRNAYRSVVSGNTVYGEGAGILVDCVAGTEIKGNVIANNTIYSTGVGASIVNGIRLGFDAEVVEDNKIVGNTIFGSNYGEFTGGIRVEAKATFTGYNNEVSNNTITITNKAYNISAALQEDMVISGNVCSNSMTSAGAYTAEMIRLDTCTQCQVKDNTLLYKTGGANVTARGVSVAATCTNVRVTNNTIRLTSASFVATAPVNDAGTTSFVKGNQVAVEPLNGSFTWTTGTANYQVSNANCSATSTVLVTPVDSDAGTIMKTSGYHVIAGAGSFTIYTSDGTNTGGASDWVYVIE